MYHQRKLEERSGSDKGIHGSPYLQGIYFYLENKLGSYMSFFKVTVKAIKSNYNILTKSFHAISLLIKHTSIPNSRSFTTSWQLLQTLKAPY